MFYTQLHFPSSMASFLILLVVKHRQTYGYIFLRTYIYHVSTDKMLYFYIADFIQDNALLMKEYVYF